MNWVGGSRNRLVMKNDAKKQREFFERRRMQQRLKNLGVSPPASTPRDTGTGSTDLMTLFIVNQIATKKANQDPPKVAVLRSCSGRSKRRRNEPLVLPMSPCSPSKLNFVESQTQSQFSVQGLRKRKNVIQKQFKCGQLSPVQESAFSDNSASDYLPAVPDPPTPTPSLSSVSSGQGLFHFQMKLQNLSQTQMQTFPPPWDTSVLQETKFQPFSQPRPMTEAVTWSCKSNSPVFQLQTPTAVQTLFGNTEPGSCGLSSKTGARCCGGDVAPFFLKQPQDQELDFTFNPSENEVFREFGDEEGQREDCNFGNRKLKIYLRDETSLRSSTPQTVPDPQSTGLEFCKYTDINSSPTCLRQNAGLLSGCESSPSCSCSAGYLSSDSHDDEEQRWQPCGQPSYMDQACCSDNLNSNSQWDHQPGPHTPQIISSRHPRDNQNVLESIANRYKAPARQSQESSSSGSGTENSELCKCKNVSTETEEAATQTDHIWTPETRDASTQYSFVSDSETRTSGLSFYQSNADMSKQPPATEIQTDAEPQTSSKNSRSEVKQMLWSKKESKPGSLSGSSSAHRFNANNGTKVILPRPTNPFVDFVGMRVKEKEPGQDEQSSLMKEAPNEVEEVTFDNRTSGVSEDDKLLQEIADILLLLKQRKKEE